MTAKYNTKIFQICYSIETRENIQPGLLALDNLTNLRPDWREYWAIRNYLLGNELEKDTLYGFFSPKFIQKTRLTNLDIQNFLLEFYKNQTVVNFSPFWDLMGIFKNIFEQGDFFHPGLSEICQNFSNNYLQGLNLKESTMHNNNTIFCNYFIAKREFWQKWLHIGEMIFDIAEENTTQLGELLNRPTSYGEHQLPMKIFVQERLASICLLENPEFTCLNYNSFNIGASTTPFNQLLSEAVISDALKRAYAETGHTIYHHEFSRLRDRIISELQN